jgi:Flp pilus assembly protein TadD
VVVSNSARYSFVGDAEPEPPTRPETPDARKTIPVPADQAAILRGAAARELAITPCRIPGYEAYTSRGYVLEIRAEIDAGNFARAEELIRRARENMALGVLRLAWTGKP